MSTPLNEFRSAIAPFVLCIAGVFVTLVSVPQLINAVRISSESDQLVATTAQLTEWNSKYSRGHTSHHLRFTYVVNGEQYEGTNDLTRSDDTEESLAQLVTSRGGRQRLTVYYAPDSPSLVAISREIPVDNFLFLFAMGVVLSGGSALWIRHRWKRRNEVPPAVEPAV